MQQLEQDQEPRDPCVGGAVVSLWSPVRLELHQGVGDMAWEQGVSKPLRLRPKKAGESRGVPESFVGGAGL